MLPSRGWKGFTAAETALFVLSLKQPVFDALRNSVKDSTELLGEIRQSGNLLDKLAMLTVTSAVAVREQTILRQQEEMLELSTPVVTLWDGILALPLIGTLDSARTQVVMESLLTAIVETNSHVAIIDITGVPTVDTLVAQHLIKTITAARLMGAECYLSGIRPAIAQTIVHLGIDLNDVQTKAKLSDAFALALKRLGKVVVTAKQSGAKAKEL
jgi:rsbT co-antagonist protein RsbR